MKLRKEVAQALGQSHSAFRAATVEIPAELVSAVGDTVVLNRAVESFIAETVAPPPPGP